MAKGISPPVADENGFRALYELMSLVTDAASKVDEIRP